MANPATSDVLLANDWPVSKVVDLINNKAKGHIIDFLRVRHEERFFDPIRHLTSSCNKQGFGFAIMALCSLLIETIQCYRYGLASTNQGELSRLGIPRAEWKDGRTAFSDFFLAQQHLFPDVDGPDFYSNIRNGLLHQAQTKGGWKIKTDCHLLCNPTDKIIDRDKFSKALMEAFEGYLRELERHEWTDEIWVKAVNKLSCLVKMSSNTPCP
jgi:hypothetical protein